MSDPEMFDDDGYLTADCEKRIQAALKEGRLTGELALAFLADRFADQTHGNYHGVTLYRRAELGDRYRVTVERI